MHVHFIACIMPIKLDPKQDEFFSDLRCPGNDLFVLGTLFNK